METAFDKTIVTETEYTESKNFVSAVTDQRGNKTSYSYDKDKLKSIDVNGNVQYKFEYDKFGRNTANLVGNGTDWFTLSSMQYNNSGLLTKQTYGNGDYVSYTYDKLDRVTEKSFNGNSNQRVTYAYGNNGSVAQAADYYTNTNTRFTYDLAERLVSQREYTGTGTSGGTLVSSTDFTYADKTNYLIGVKHNSPLGKMDISYIYGNIQKGYMPDQVYFVNWNGERKLSNAFDALGRLEKRWYAGNTAFYTKYAYEDVGTDKTTTLVKSAETPAGTYTYTYDALGNITSVNDGTYTTSYVYDSLNQLIRENDERAGKTYTYAYTNGNITDKKTYYYTTGELGSEIGYKTWEYENSTWGDLLTNYDGTEITYDEIGNPVTYGAASLEWQGRQLQSITEDGVTAGYEYNGEGQRVSKTFDGVTTEFYYNGSILAGQKTGEDTILFEYDNNGDPFAFLYNGTEYFYVKNAQNDVTAIANAMGTVLANYYYDAWGNILTISGDTALANANPIRYRSYYCDTETGWYYLNSRYYAPEMCRFLNADDSEILFDEQEDIMQYNLFAYCWNSPTNMIDETGESPANIIGGIIGGVTGAALGYLLAKHLGLTGWKKAALIAAAAIGGAALGAFLGPYVAKLGGKIAVKLGIKSVPKFGSQIGRLGKLVKNTRPVMNGFTKHGLERAIERGVSSKMIKRIIKSGYAISQGGGKTLFFTKAGAVVLNKCGEVVTAYSSKDFDSAMRAIIKQFYG